MRRILQLVLLSFIAISTGALCSETSLELTYPSVEWETIRGRDIGWDEALLDDALAYAKNQQSSGVVVVHQGRILTEGHWAVAGSLFYKLLHIEEGPGHQAFEDVASMQKSLIAILAAFASASGQLDVTSSVSNYLGDGWSDAEGADEAAVTVQHLLSMTSGLDTDLEFKAPAGTQWRYNTNAYSLLVPILEKTVEKSIEEMTFDWITNRIGMSESGWGRRYWVLPGMDANIVGFETTARDMARLGVLMLSGGEWDGKKLIPMDELAKLHTPSQLLNPSYGYLWWLNGKALLRDGKLTMDGLVPSAPGDMYAAQGALSRRLYVVPSMGLVVTRLGDTPTDENFDQVFWEKLMKASPADNLCGQCNGAISDELSSVKSVGGAYISWKEHIIDDPAIGIADLSGSDGLSMADLDKDGFEDIVSVHESDTVYDGKPVGHVRIAWGSGDPMIWELTTLASGTEAAAAEDVTLGDINGDGLIDVVVACELAHLIYFENPGNAARTAPWKRVILDVSEGRGSYIRVFAEDFDGDARLEVVAANKGEQNPKITDAPLNNISLYLPPAEPLDGKGWKEKVLGKVKIPINSEPVDLDGDGDLDIVAGSRAEARILWFENQGALKFTERPIVVPEAPSNLSITGFNMDYADINGDGLTDIVSTAWPGVITLLLQPKDKSDSWGYYLIGGAAPDQLVSLRLADIDGDGDLDIFSGAYSGGPREHDGPLISANSPLGRISWFENPGGNVRSNWPRHDISRRKRGMYDKWLFRDLDGDGDLDVLGTRGNSEPYDGVFWLEQVRTKTPEKVFSQARTIDSIQMSLP